MWTEKGRDIALIMVQICDIDFILLLLEIIKVNILFQTIIHIDIKEIYKTYIVNKLKIRTNDNQ